MRFVATTLALLVASALALPCEERLDSLFAAKCVCLPAGMTDKPISSAPYPPCWYKQKDGHYDCYDKLNGNCPWNGAVGPCPDDSPAPAPPKCVCLPAGMKDKPISAAPYPPCWYKQADGHYDCYNKISGNCPWNGAVGPCPGSSAVDGQNVLSVSVVVEGIEGLKVDVASGNEL